MKAPGWRRENVIAKKVPGSYQFILGNREGKSKTPTLEAKNKTTFPLLPCDHETKVARHNMRAKIESRLWPRGQNLALIIEF